MSAKVDLVGPLKKWYSNVSAIAHGQVPGDWLEHKSLSDIKYAKKTLELAAGAFVEGEEITHKLFLCTAGREFWDHFSSQSKRALLKGLTGAVKEKLGLDEA